MLCLEFTSNRCRVERILLHALQVNVKSVSWHSLNVDLLFLSESVWVSVTDRRLCVCVWVNFSAFRISLRNCLTFYQLPPKPHTFQFTVALHYSHHSSIIHPLFHLFIYSFAYLLTYLLIYLFDCLFVCLYVHYLFINQPESQSVTRQIVNCFILRWWVSRYWFWSIEVDVVWFSSRRFGV